MPCYGLIGRADSEKRLHRFNTPPTDSSRASGYTESGEFFYILFSFSPAEGLLGAAEVLEGGGNQLEKTTGPRRQRIR
jgi:hypothetical protein